MGYGWRLRERRARALVGVEVVARDLIEDALGKDDADVNAAGDVGEELSCDYQSGTVAPDRAIRH